MVFSMFKAIPFTKVVIFLPKLLRSLSILSTELNSELSHWNWCVTKTCLVITFVSLEVHHTYWWQIPNHL